MFSYWSFITVVLSLILAVYDQTKQYDKAQGNERMPKADKIIHERGIGSEHKVKLLKNVGKFESRHTVKDDQKFNGGKKREMKNKFMKKEKRKKKIKMKRKIARVKNAHTRKGKKKHQDRSSKRERNESPSCRNEEECLTNVFNSLIVHKTRVVNFFSQKKRLDRYLNAAEKKKDKRNFIDRAISDLRRAIGENTTRPVCGGQYDTRVGNEGLELYNKMMKCNMTILDKCSISLIQSDENEINVCFEKMSEFNNSSEFCLTRRTNCNCWSTLNVSIQEVKDCNEPLKTKERDILKLKNICFDAFRNCKRYEDESRRYISTCKTNIDMMRNMLISLKYSKALLEAVNNKTSTLVNSQMKTHRSKRQGSTSISGEILNWSTLINEIISTKSVDDLGTDSSLKQAGTSIIQVAMANITIIKKQEEKIISFQDKIKCVIVDIKTRISEISTMLTDVGGSIIVTVPPLLPEPTSIATTSNICTLINETLLQTTSKLTKHENVSTNLSLQSSPLSSITHASSSRIPINEMPSVGFSTPSSHTLNSDDISSLALSTLLSDAQTPTQSIRTSSVDTVVTSQLSVLPTNFIATEIPDVSPIMDTTTGANKPTNFNATEIPVVSTTMDTTSTEVMGIVTTSSTTRRNHIVNTTTGANKPTNFNATEILVVSTTMDTTEVMAIVTTSSSTRRTRMVERFLTRNLMRHSNDMVSRSRGHYNIFDKLMTKDYKRKKFE